MVIYFMWRPFFYERLTGELVFQKPWIAWIDKKEKGFCIRKPSFYDPYAKFGENGYIERSMKNDSDIKRLYGRFLK